MSASRKRDIENVTYMNIYVNIIQLLKKKETLSSTTKEMDFEDIMPSERSQTQKDKCYMISFICGI